jgi:hypothetical protein
VRVQWFHFTATVTARAPSLCEPRAAAWLWSRLRSAFPEAIAVVLMPEHVHLVLATADPAACRRRLARLLGQFGRAFGVRGQVSVVPAPALIRGGDVLARQVRYVLLNPCRERLARCPLAWQWSTHRDVVGATVDPWVTAARLASALDIPADDFAVRHHAYVSGDPSVRVDGTPVPTPVAMTAMAAFPLRTIAEAAGAALRRPLTDVRRRGPMRALFVALAFDQGWKNTAQLAEICDVRRRAIHELVRGVDETWLQAARLCLADERLYAAHRLRSVQTAALPRP